MKGVCQHPEFIVSVQESERMPFCLLGRFMVEDDAREFACRYVESHKYDSAAPGYPVVLFQERYGYKDDAVFVDRLKLFPNADDCFFVESVEYPEVERPFCQFDKGVDLNSVKPNRPLHHVSDSGYTITQWLGEGGMWHFVFRTASGDEVARFTTQYSFMVWRFSQVFGRQWRLVEE